MPSRQFPILGVILGGTLFFGVLQGRGEDAPVSQPPCEGKYQGQKLSPDELTKVLADHKAWFQEAMEGKVKVGAPDERQANLCEASLSEANLTGADLNGANLTGADLNGANLTGADLNGANLTGADLNGANLTGAYLNGANLTGAHLNGANLTGTTLTDVNLAEAQLFVANLTGAHLARANLTRAFLFGANLTRAFLFAANLTKASLLEANLQGVFFEPISESLPVVSLAARAQGLSEITFDSPFAAVELREAFKKAGLREPQRQLTRAINYRQTHRAIEEGDISEHLDARFRWLLFEKTCEYGWFPGRPLRILGFFLLLFTIFYRIALSTRGYAGIWAIWSPDRIHKSDGQDTPERVTDEFGFSRFAGTRWENLIRQLRLLWYAFYFSLLSAFHLGWRELNVGTWISRIQPREYTLRATGWVRVVAGIQSLLSVYLVALWALTYFGNPFE